MPVVTKYICDGCGKEKGETNHWMVTFQGDLAISVATWDQLNQHADAEIVKVHCGESCALKAVSAWMQERKEQDTETGKG